MKLNVVGAPTILEAAKALIKTIDNSDISLEHIIIVPDRFSLQAEKLVFEQTGKDSVFNVSVMGVNALSLKYLSELNIEAESLNNAQSLILTEKAMKNVQAELLTYKKTNINFVHEVQKVIAQLKSCDILPEELECIYSLVLSKNKFHDSGLIYKEYQTLLGDKVDANKQLDVLIDRMEELSLQNTNFYFAGFDSFTEKTYKLICALIKNAQSVNVACAKPLTSNNEYIYEDDIQTKLGQIATDLGIIIPAQYEKCTITSSQERILKNLYSGTIESQDEDFYIPLSASSKIEEVSAAAKIITKSIHNGARYEDFTIACSNLDKYSLLLERVFAEHDIPFFMDKSLTADKTMLASLIFKFFDVVLSNYSKENILAILSSDLLDIGKREELISCVSRYNVEGKIKFKKFIASRLGVLANIFDEMEKATRVSNFYKAVESILTISEEGFDKLQQYCEEENLLKEKNINSQAKEIILEACQIVLSLEDEISLKEFSKKLKLILSFKEVLSVPTFVDGVYIADATSSFYGDNKNLIILGCENLPLVTLDNGLISDDDIVAAQIKKKIEPSIRMLNRRSRFKLFCLVASAKERLFTSFLTINEEGKKTEVPLFVDQLTKMFNSKTLPAGRILDLKNENENNFLTALGSKKSALRSIARFYRSGNIDNGNVASLSNVLKPDYQKYSLEREYIDGKIDKVFFPKGYTKVTQLENYFSCPFKHFVRYGLKLKENETAEFDGRDNGNVCHKMSELFVKQFGQVMSDVPESEIPKFISQNFDFVLREENLIEKFEVVSDKNALRSFLFSQCKLILRRIRYELASSHFKPFAVEKRIDNLALNYKDDKLPLVGKVDRIDVAEDYFRIIDYKTGRVDGIAKDLYYGDKLQLFLYQKAVSQKLNKKSAGTFYFDSKWDYQNLDKDVRILKGLAAKDDEALILFDKDLDNKIKSDLVGIALSTAKKKTSTFTGSAIAKHPLSLFENYAVEVGNKALSEIGSGFIAPKPDEDACMSCKYSGICLHCKEKGYRKKENVSQDDIAKVFSGEGGDDE